jgi:DNA-binding winged helix-turn-helix (wHTH) protein
LIPRYFDLLLLLLERRNEAVQRREILDAVWSDVVVSDGALSQAIRTLRRALGDDSRGQVFIRTIPRHGYRFVFPDVAEESDGQPLPASPPEAPHVEPRGEEQDPFAAPLAVLLDNAHATGEESADRRRGAAERLHALGTAEALRRLADRRGSAATRALMRDARWDVPGAGRVPIVGQPGAPAVALALVRLRVRRALRLARSRWLSAAGGGAVAGLSAGAAGAAVLRFAPGSTAGNGVLVALSLVGFLVGGLGAAGVGAGLAAAEALIRSSRGLALTLFGALGGGAIGAATHFVGRLLLQSLFGRDLSPLGGGLEGLLIGGAAGLGYAVSTPRAEGGMATPRGARRTLAALATGLSCATAALLLALSGRYLGAMSLDFMARSFPDSQVGLGPLARLLGEERPAVVTAAVISAWEGLLFGIGLVIGLTRRPG